MSEFAQSHDAARRRHPPGRRSHARAGIGLILLVLLLAGAGFWPAESAGIGGGRREGSVTWRGEEHGSGSGPLGGDLSETSDNWGGWTSSGHPLDGSVTVTRPDGVSLDLGFAAGGVFSGLTRGDGSGFSLRRHGTGRVDLVTRFDAFGSHVTDLHFDQNLGAPTGFTATGPGSPATDITCVVVPVDSGTYLGRPWQVDFTSPGPPGSGPVSVFTEYTYFAGAPATEVHAGLLAGFEVERLRNATTGDTEYVALRRDGQVVHQVAYGYSTGGRLVDFTTSVSADLTSGYQYLAGTRWIETLTRDAAPGGTATPVVETRVPETGGRLGSVSTAGASGTYASAYTYLGHRRDSLARSFPAAGPGPAATWNWDYAYALRGQLQTADSNQGHDYDYQHDAMGDRAAGAANPANQYSILHIPGTRAFRLEGTAAPGSTLVAERPGEPPLPLVQQPDGTFSAILPVDPAFPDDQIAVGEVTVTGTRPGEGDGGGDAVAKLVRTAVSPPSAAPLAYGAHGAVAQDWRWDYSWNVLGRLGRMETRAEATAAGLPNLTLHFNYDHRGRRVLKTVEHKDAAGTVQRTVTTRFLHDGWDLLGEFTTDADNPGTETQRYYTWGLDIDGTRDGAGGVGGLVAIHEDGATYLPVHDGTGNIVALLDEGGAELARWHRGPFGEPLAESGQTHLCPFGFATHYTDAETGLVYFGMRYYSPTQGRWLSREPLGEFESQNLYAYAGNDPVNGYDYLGLDRILIEDGKVYWVLTTTRFLLSDPEIARIEIGRDGLDGVGLNFALFEDGRSSNIGLGGLRKLAREFNLGYVAGGAERNAELIQYVVFSERDSLWKPTPEEAWAQKVAVSHLPGATADGVSHVSGLNRAMGKDINYQGFSQMSNALGELAKPATMIASPPVRAVNPGAVGGGLTRLLAEEFPAAARPIYALRQGAYAAEDAIAFVYSGLKNVRKGSDGRLLADVVISDALPDGTGGYHIVTEISDGLAHVDETYKHMGFYGIENANGAKVWLAFREVKGRELANLAWHLEQASPVIIAGRHGDAFGRVIPDEKIRFADLLRHYANYTDELVDPLSSRVLNIVNGDRDVICGWCWSARTFE